MQNNKTIAIIDYSSFPNDYYYVNSISELTDELGKRNINIYALLEDDNLCYVLGSNVSGLIYYTLDELTVGRNLLSKIVRTIGCSDKTQYVLISSNPQLLGIFDLYGFDTCMVNNGCNDVVSLKRTIEYSDIDKVKNYLHE